MNAGTCEEQLQVRSFMELQEMEEQRLDSNKETKQRTRSRSYTREQTTDLQNSSGGNGSALFFLEMQLVKKNYREKKPKKTTSNTFLKLKVCRVAVQCECVCFNRCIFLTFFAL